MLEKVIEDEKRRTTPIDAVGINMRFPSDVHRKLSAIAHSNQLSLNGLVMAILKEAVSSEK